MNTQNTMPSQYHKKSKVRSTQNMGVPPLFSCLGHWAYYYIYMFQ